MKEVTECVSNSLESKAIPTYDVIPLENGDKLVKLTHEELILLVGDAHYSLDWEKQRACRSYSEYRPK